MTDTLLGAYDSAIGQATRAVAALDNLAMKTSAPSAILAIARAAAQNQQATTPAPPQTARPSQLPARVRDASNLVERRLRDLGISDPALLLRAASIDEAANDLIAEAIATSHRRNAAVARPTADANRTHQATHHAAHLAAKDSPVSAPSPDRQAGRPASLPTRPLGRHRSPAGDTDASRQLGAHR